MPGDLGVFIASSPVPRTLWFIGAGGRLAMVAAAACQRQEVMCGEGDGALCPPSGWSFVGSPLLGAKDTTLGVAPERESRPAHCAGSVGCTLGALSVSSGALTAARREGSESGEAPVLFQVFTV